MSVDAITETYISMCLDFSEYVCVHDVVLISQKS